MHRLFKVRQQLWSQVVIEEVDEASESLGGPGSLRWLVQQVNQLVVNIGSARVGLAEHAADHPGPGRVAEQGCAQPALAHQGFQQWPDPSHPGRLAGQLFVIHQPLGAVDQYHALAVHPQPLGCAEHHYTADRIAHQQHRALHDLPAEGLHLLSPEIEAIHKRFIARCLEVGIGIAGQHGPWLTAAAEADQIEGEGGGSLCQRRHGVTPVAAAGTEAMHQHHRRRCTVVLALPAPGHIEIAAIGLLPGPVGRVRWHWQRIHPHHRLLVFCRRSVLPDP